MEDVAEALELKADQENVFTYLNEIKECLNNKADKSELINVNEELKNNVEIFKEGINNHINELMKNKSDINDFKLINDTFGHAEGDSALVIVAQSLVRTVQNHSYQVFLGRYGGDEFVLIAHPVSDDEIPELEKEIRECIRLRCKNDHKPYILSVGIGYDKLLEGEDSLQKCMQRADEKLYLNKEYVKSNEKSTAQA